jgi:hypothetical protein
MPAISASDELCNAKRFPAVDQSSPFRKKYRTQLGDFACPTILLVDSRILINPLPIF